MSTICIRVDKVEASWPIDPDGLHLHTPLTLLHKHLQIQAANLREPRIFLGGRYEYLLWRCRVNIYRKGSDALWMCLRREYYKI